MRIPTVRVLNSEGNQIGVMSSKEALQMAQEAALDLVLVAENATPPVCKIADYGKLKYMEAKRKKENQKKAQDIKGLKISPRISDHDLHTIANKARGFLTDGDKVRVTCQFRNREITHSDIGRSRLEKLVEQLDEVGTIEAPPALEGRLMVMVLRPKAA